MLFHISDLPVSKMENLSVNYKSEKINYSLFEINNVILEAKSFFNE